MTIPTSLFQGLRHRIAKGVGSVRGARRPHRWVGLDLGSASIKLAEIEQTKSGLRLIRVAVKELPASPDGQEADQIRWVREAMEEFDAHEVHIAVSGPEVAVRRVQVPPMSQRELPEAVRWQIKDELPFPTEDAIVDFRLIGEVWEGDLKKLDLLVGAASKAFVQDLVAMVERPGLRVASVSPVPLAVWHSAEIQLAQNAQEGSVVLIEIGAGTTQVAIVKEGNLCMVRELLIGSENITAALVGETVSDEGIVSIDRSQAESLKRRYGVLGEDAGGVTEEGVPLGHMASLMRPVLESLLTDVSRFIDFYRVQMEEGEVSRVLFCGGGANLKSLQPFLADSLGITVEILNPLASITDRVQPLGAEQIAESGPRLAVAMGLALDHGQGLNLLPAKAQRAGGLEVSRNIWLMAAKAAAGVALVLYLGLQAGVLILSRQVRAHETEWARLESSYTGYMKATRGRKKFEAETSRLELFLNQQPIWDGILKELSVLMPPTIELDELTVIASRNGAGPSPQRIRLKGRVVAKELSRDGSIGPFVEAMNRSVFFRAVGLTSSEMHSGETGMTQFEIEGWLR